MLILFHQTIKIKLLLIPKRYQHDYLYTQGEKEFGHELSRVALLFKQQVKML